MVRLSSNYNLIKPKAFEKNKVYGRGNRVRKQVNYCDDLTDEQFMRMCEEEGEEEDEIEGSESSLVDVPGKRKRKGKLSRNDSKSKIGDS